MRPQKFRNVRPKLPQIFTALRQETPRRDAGMATAEYAIVMLAAAAFAGLLMLVLRSDAVREMLTSIVQQALSI